MAIWTISLQQDPNLYVLLQDSETFAVLLHLAELLLQPGGQQLAEYGYLDRMWAADQEIVREPGEARLLAVSSRCPRVAEVTGGCRRHAGAAWAMLQGCLGMSCREHLS